jgi:hypothetical protein
MKCGYNHCKLGGNVEKDVAIKYNKRYYHKQCYNKKIKKREIYDILRNNGFVAKSINLALKQIIDDDGTDVDLLLFTVNYVIDNRKELNNPFGLKYYIQNYEIIDKYKKISRIKRLKALNDKDRNIEVEEEVKFTHTEKLPKYLKIDR